MSKLSVPQFRKVSLAISELGTASFLRGTAGSPQRGSRRSADFLARLTTFGTVPARKSDVPLRNSPPQAYITLLAAGDAERRPLPSTRSFRAGGVRRSGRPGNEDGRRGRAAAGPAASDK